MNLPAHIAIIMDGNGRWGLKKYNDRNKGHYYGLKNVYEVIKNSIKLNIKYLTLYTFSTENWNRPKQEIDYLFFLFQFFYKKNFNKLNKENIRVKFIGNLNSIPKKLKKIINIVKSKTKKNTRMTVCFAFNYGSRSELVSSVNKSIKNSQKIKKVTEEMISKNLYTAKIPDPDILIRTGGYQRLSNFLLWQLSYSEIFFLKKSWPDFNYVDLKKIVNKFSSIKRNFGSIDE
jgi:undecaprenyl diphosphate synthase